MDQVFDELSSDGVECVEYYSDCDENAQYMDRRVDGIPSWGLIILKEQFLSLSLSMAFKGSGGARSPAMFFLKWNIPE